MTGSFGFSIRLPADLFGLSCNQKAHLFLDILLFAVPLPLSVCPLPSLPFILYLFFLTCFFFSFGRFMIWWHGHDQATKTMTKTIVRYTLQANVTNDSSVGGQSSVKTFVIRYPGLPVYLLLFLLIIIKYDDDTVSSTLLTSSVPCSLISYYLVSFLSFKFVSFRFRTLFFFSLRFFFFEN